VQDPLRLANIVELIIRREMGVAGTSAPKPLLSRPDFCRGQKRGSPYKGAR
jgi:hypothetical protein